MSLSSREWAEIQALLAPVVEAIAVLSAAVEQICQDLGVDPSIEVDAESTEQDHSHVDA